MTPLEKIAREATGRIVASLARRCGDLALAEDALSTALVAAVEQWDDPPPRNPEAWLYQVARRKLHDASRHDAVRARKAAALAALHDAAAGPEWPDDRLPLLLVCAHPAIAPAVRAPLMLQAVLGLTAEQVAPLVGRSARAVGQQLWRAKQKIKEAGIPFRVPEGPELDRRLHAVLDAIHGLFTLGWKSRSSERRQDALWLSRVVVEVLPTHDEAWGLRALLLYVQARVRDDPVYVPLSEQDPRAWNTDALDAAELALRRAQRGGTLGPFQLEAALQSALVDGHRRGAVDHDAVAALYDGLLALAPTMGLRVGRVAAIAERSGPAAAWPELDALTGMERFQPYWAVRAHLAALLGRPDALDARQRAIELCDDPHRQRYLLGLRSVQRE